MGQYWYWYIHRLVKKGDNMERYSATVTSKKTATTATTVSVAGIAAVIIANKIQPVLTAYGNHDVYIDLRKSGGVTVMKPTSINTSIGF